MTRSERPAALANAAGSKDAFSWTATRPEYAPSPLLTQELRFSRATTGTYRFDVAEGDFDEARLRCIYVRRGAFAGAEPPKRIVVTVAVARDGGAQ